MKTTYTFLLACLFIALETTAQNYQPIRSDFQHYYINSNNYLVGLKLDSAREVNGDSVFYNFRTYRTLSEIDCEVMPFAPSWVGKNVLMKPNGWVYFLNRDSDTLKISTNGPVSFTWNAFTLNSSGDYLEAEILPSTQEVFFGHGDSVRWISLNAKNSLGNPIQHIINGKKLGISKNFGIYEWPDMFWFPEATIFYTLAGRDNPREGLHIPSWGEVYDMQPGDEFHYEASGAGMIYNNNLFGNVYFKDSILAVSNSGITKTVNFLRRGFRDGWFIPGFEFLGVSNGVFIDTLTWHVADTSELTSGGLMPMQYVNTDTQYRLISNQIGYGRELIEMPDYLEYTYSTTVNDTQPCSYPLGTVSGGRWTKDTFIRGCGLYSRYRTIHDEFASQYFNDQLYLVYYKKGNEEWGNPISESILTGENEILSLPLELFPNPAQETLTLSGIEFKPNMKIQILDLQGRLMLEREINEAGATVYDLDVSGLSTGLYLLNLEAQGTRTTKKFIKN